MTAARAAARGPSRPRARIRAPRTCAYSVRLTATSCPRGCQARWRRLLMCCADCRWEAASSGILDMFRGTLFNCLPIRSQGAQKGKRAPDKALDRERSAPVAYYRSRPRRGSPGTRASHQFCLLVSYSPLANYLLRTLHLSAWCNRQDLSKAIEACKIVYSAATPHRCIFSRQFGATSQCRSLCQLHTR